jgi:hypothetical protein
MKNILQTGDGEKLFLAAHTMLAIDKGFSEEETLAIRKG